MTANSRVPYIDISKALCIILVVIGHFNPSVSPSWWPELFKGIYAFHMPAFMFLSGLLYSMTYREESYLSFMGRKAKRLMIPYLCASAIIIGIKLLGQSFMPVKNTVSAYSLLQMFWCPSAAYHLWFVWALMWIFAIVKPLRNRQAPMMALFAVSLLLWIFPVKLPTIFCLDHIPSMLVFFMAGCISNQVMKSCEGKKVPLILKILPILLFAAAETAYIALDSGTKLFGALCSWFGIVSVLLLSKGLENGGNKLKNAFVAVGECSFFIYLFHTTFTEPVKSLLAGIGLDPLQHFTVMLLLSSLAGILLPMLIQKLVIEKSRILSFLFGIRRPTRP